MSIWWANERPSSSDSEDSEPEIVEWPKNNYTLIHIAIAHIIIVLASIFLCQLHSLQSCEERFKEFKCEFNSNNSTRQHHVRFFFITWKMRYLKFRFWTSENHLLQGSNWQYIDTTDTSQTIWVESIILLRLSMIGRLIKLVFEKLFSIDMKDL